MTSPLTTVYRVAPGIAWVDSVEGQATAVGDALAEDQQPEAWIAVVPDGEPLSLNGSGLVVWRGCSDGGTIGEITARVRALVDTDDVPEEDVAAFVTELVARGLLVATAGE